MSRLERDARTYPPAGKAIRTSAFSLLEVLVVVSIIAILIAVLLPSIAASRQRAKAIYCLTRLKDIGVATASYAASNQDLLPPSTIDWHPTQMRRAAELGFDRSTMPVMYGWAELLYESMHPSDSVDDFEEFAPGKWSHFPAQRNYRDKYGRVFNCPQALKQVTHGAHFRVYLPAWANEALVLDERRRVENFLIFPASYSSMQISRISGNWVLMGDANEFSSQGDYDGDPLLPNWGPHDCPEYESSTISLYAIEGSGELIGGANPVEDTCHSERGAMRFSHRHDGRANYLFGDLHAEGSATLREKLACDVDLNGVRDVVSDEARAAGGCEIFQEP